eukprot:TRINITY_DN40501_c0_g1_i1.p1 TRINITY_DN40501_c0_g1~~TRINITY_DN40501_c0_g1_i1.p1  ORF type:complete len:652 (-),score=82.00 TRINITY_DN40501_c0_g1_i1:241-2196(-)
MSRATTRRAIRSQYHFVKNDEEAFSVFGRSEVQDVTRIRQVTDATCLLCMVAVIIGMLILDSNGRTYGNVLRLSEPIDYKGGLCGFDEGLEDKPLGYYPNPYCDMIVCVSACPKTASDGNFSLPDGPMGKFYTRTAYPTSRIVGQNCLPLDLALAKTIIMTKSVQSEVYRSFGFVFTSSGVLLVVLGISFAISFILLMSLLHIPSAASTFVFSTTAVTLVLLAFTMDLDADVLKGIPLYPETHPLMLHLLPYFRDACYAGAVLFAGFLLLSIQQLSRADPVFKECMSAIIHKNVLVTIFASMIISCFRIYFIIHITKHAALLMSIVNPVGVQVQLLGEWHNVDRSAWSPFFLHGLVFYAFGGAWVLEFMSFSNKYITAQILCQNYFSMKARNNQGEELNHGVPNPLGYAVHSLIRYHLGSAAFAAFFSAPCNFLRFIISFFVPDRANLLASPNLQFQLAYYLFWPLIQMDISFLRFFKNSVWVMLPLKGYKYMDAARRSEGLLNRCRGKIPNLTKFTGKIEVFLNISVGLVTMFWTFYLFREPRHGRYHEVEHLATKDAILGVMQVPRHSPLLALPITFFFGLWVGNGTLHLVGMASQTLTMCYCIDVEMAGGTETDAHYVPDSLRYVYTDLGGGESERELSEMIEQSVAG